MVNIQKGTQKMIVSKDKSYNWRTKYKQADTHAFFYLNRFGAYL